MLDTTTILLTPPKESLWTEERIEIARKGWADGLSATAIAQKLDCGFTRSAVLGKLHRLGCKQPAHKAALYISKPRRQAGFRPASYRRPLNQEERAQRAAERSAARLMLKAEADARRIALGQAPKGFECSLLELNHDRCHFPNGDPGEADFHFCGAPPIDGRSYCKFHHAFTHDRPRTLARQTRFNGRSYQRQDARG